MPPTPDEVRGQLERLLASDAFARTDRLSRFLRFVVERALAGEAATLKEYVIGLEVYDRHDDYDPRVDSIVRVEAGRLRSKLESYYHDGGRLDPVVIAIPRGGYAPAFERRETRTARADVAAGPTPPGPTRRRRLAVAVVAATVALLAVAAWRAGMWATEEGSPARLAVVVLPFAHFTTSTDDGLLAARLTDGVTSALARLGTVGVVSHTSAARFAASGRPLSDAVEALDADVVMEASAFHEADRVRIEVRLVDAARDRKFWVADFTGNAADPAELERRVAEAVASAAGRMRD